MAKRIVFLLTVMIIISGCSADEYFSSKYENKIPEGAYEKFDSDMSDIFLWEDDGKISADFGFKRGRQDDSDVILEGHGVEIWGTSTLAEFELNTEEEIAISREEKDGSGKFRLLLCDENGIIEFIDKNDSKTVKLQAGSYKVKVVGEPARLGKLCIKLSKIPL